MKRKLETGYTTPVPLWDSEQYALLDFGNGRKLERFDSWTLDRPCPAALAEGRTSPSDWQAAGSRLDSDGDLLAGQPPPPLWQCSFSAPQFEGSLQFQLKLTPFGHVGLFPEQASNWRWLAGLIDELRQHNSPLPPQALNLFAYTGGSSLAMAAAGAAVVHVDASTPSIKWARNNAALSGGTQWPIRWIVDDARKFVARQVRRGKRYQLIVLDPPSYGHGASGQRWSLSQHLQSLLSDCLELLEPQRGILLLTAHCETPTAGDIAQWLKSQVPTAHVEHDRLQLAAQSGKLLDAGFYVRFALNRNTQLLRLA